MDSYNLDIKTKTLIGKILIEGVEKNYSELFNILNNDNLLFKDFAYLQMALNLYGTSPLLKLKIQELENKFLFDYLKENNQNFNNNNNDDNNNNIRHVESIPNPDKEKQFIPLTKEEALKWIFDDTNLWPETGVARIDQKFSYIDEDGSEKEVIRKFYINNHGQVTQFLGEHIKTIESVDNYVGILADLLEENIEEEECNEEEL